MSKYISKRFSSLRAYTPGEQPQDKKYIKLNTNESPFPPALGVIEAVNKAEISNLMLYPDPETAEIKKVIAKKYGLNTDEIIMGNGSDEILAFSFFAFCDKDTGVCFPDITYGFYEVYADLYGYSKEIIPLNENFEIVTEDYFGKNKTIFIANPNAPTGIGLPLNTIEEIIKKNPDNVVVIDEAYVDFGGESAVPLIHKYDNLLVVQTFSKSRSLAGARLGMALGNSGLINDLNKIKFSFNPYNINRLTLICGAEAMKDDAYFEKCVSEIKNVRKKTVNELKKSDFTVLDSCTNFIFAKSAEISGYDLYKSLKEKGILVRHWNNERIKDFVRITIGPLKQMEALLKAVKDI